MAVHAIRSSLGVHCPENGVFEGSPPNAAGFKNLWDSPKLRLQKFPANQYRAKVRPIRDSKGRI